MPATALFCMVGGTISRTKLIATGMYPMASPCRTRPTSTGTIDEDSAQTSDPTSRMSAEATSTGLRPLMSAILPETGIATPPASRVAVTTQAALLGPVSRSRGRSGWIGMTSDCMSAAHILEKPSTRMMSSGAESVLSGVSRTGSFRIRSHTARM